MRLWEFFFLSVFALKIHAHCPPRTNNNGRSPSVPIYRERNVFAPSRSNTASPLRASITRGTRIQVYATPHVRTAAAATCAHPPIVVDFFFSFVLFFSSSHIFLLLLLLLLRLRLLFFLLFFSANRKQSNGSRIIIYICTCTIVYEPKP